MEFLGHRGAADHVAPVDHLHAQAGHRQIGRASEAVMSGADDDNVRFRHGRFKKVLIDAVIPGHRAAMNPESRDSGFALSRAPE